MDPLDAESEKLSHWVADATARYAGELPAFPHAAARLLDSLRQPDVRVGELESLISQDQVITAQVLRTANSALYGGAMSVERVSDAIMRLGFRETAYVAMAAACRGLYDAGDRAERQVFPQVWSAMWQDSLVCGYGARLLAKELECADPDQVFLAGMLRDVGSLLILKLVARGLARRRLRRAPGEAVLEAVIAELHERLGGRYLRGCHMPDHVVNTALQHHARFLPPGAASAGLHVVRLADGLCHRIGVAPFAREVLGEVAEQSIEALELTPERVEYFELQFRALFEQLQELL